MARRLKVLAPTQYPWSFNGPRSSRHDVRTRTFLPMNKITPKLEGVTVFRPRLGDAGVDLLHAFNRIPLGFTPYVIGFESHLPRAFWMEHTAYYRALQGSLASPRCRGIFAISEHARTIFTDVVKAWPEIEAEVLPKLRLRYPNIVVPPPEETPPSLSGEAVVTFVGAHFARKGGCVAVVMAKLARERGVPLRVEVVSNLECGGGIWTDPPDQAFFEPYLRLLDAPNVVARPGLPNAQVLEMLSRSHFSFLPTFSDTFGYSVIESMARSTPVVGTTQGALPELIEDDVDGVLLDLPVTPRGEWIHSASPNRDTPEFRTMYRAEIERLAEAALGRITALLNAPNHYAAMRRAARSKASRLCAAEPAQAFWDDVYDRAAI